MGDKSIEERVKELVIAKFGLACYPERVKAEAVLARDFGADSLDLVELSFEIEDKFSLPEISEADCEQMKTVGDVVKYVEGKLGEAGVSTD